MRTLPIFQTFAAAIAALTLNVASAQAYVDIELDGGSHVKGESYSSSPESGKLVVYRPSGAIEIDRSKVRSIREVDGSLTEDAALSRPSAATAPAAVPESSTWAMRLPAFLEWCPGLSAKRSGVNSASCLIVSFSKGSPMVTPCEAGPAEAVIESDHPSCRTECM